MQVPQVCLHYAIRTHWPNVRLSTSELTSSIRTPAKSRSALEFAQYISRLANARRVIPLCGVSLEAMRKFPQGFPRYRKSPASLSATINKFLREDGLLETPKHSLYGLRHSFEDRQLGAGVDERIRRDLMGHALKRERYGKGASLDHLLSLVHATAL